MKKVTNNIRRMKFQRHTTIHKLPPRDAAQDARSAQEPQRTEEPEEAENSCRPQDNLEEPRGPCRGCVLLGSVFEAIKIGMERKLTVRHMRSIPSAVINNDKIKLLKIHSNSKLVRKFRYESSIDFSYSSSGSSNGASARFTVDSNWLSISACGLSNSSMKLVFIPSFCVCADGNASALSEPLVPQDTSCQLQNA